MERTFASNRSLRSQSKRKNRKRTTQEMLKKSMKLEWELMPEPCSEKEEEKDRNNFHQKADEIQEYSLGN